MEWRICTGKDETEQEYFEYECWTHEYSTNNKEDAENHVKECHPQDLILSRRLYNPNPTSLPNLYCRSSKVSKRQKSICPGPAIRWMLKNVTKYPIK